MAKSHGTPSAARRESFIRPLIVSYHYRSAGSSLAASLSPAPAALRGTSFGAKPSTPIPAPGGQVMSSLSLVRCLVEGSFRSVAVAVTNLKQTLTGFDVLSGLLLPRMVLKCLLRCCASKQYGDDEEKIDFGGGNVHVVKSKEDWDQKVAEANKDGKIVVANFSASWCGPCRVISPLYAEMSQTYPQLMFLAIDVDELMDFSSSWDIRATPTFFFLKNGQQVDKLVGANKVELEKKVTALAGAGPSGASGNSVPS